MKCKSWSHKINNFVVRRLKSIKINDQQQQTVTDTTSAASIQQPCLPPSKQKTAAFTSSSTMPASQPKEKATAVSLNESNFSELKLKELTNAVITTVPSTGGGAAAAMGTTVTTVPVPPNSTNGRLAVVTTQPPVIVNSPKHQQQHNLSSSSASMSSSTIATSAAAAVSIQQHPSICGCGNISAADTLTMPHKYINNRHSSPLTAAMAAQSPILTARNSSPLRSNHMSCCRLRHNHANGIAINNNNNNNNYYNNNNSSTTVLASQVTSSAVCDATTAATPTGATVVTTPATAVTPPKKSPKDFIFGKYIGEGSFSMVYLAVDINTKREYAIKVCEKRQILREHKQEYIKREREVMHTMTGVPGFVSLSCTFQDPRSLYFVMTYAKNGDLLPYINKVGSFDVDCTRHYAAELVLACEQMHRRNIVHRDLKPENILLDEDMHTLIADFGSAKILTAKERESADEFLRTGGSDLTKKLRSQSGGSESGGSGSGGGASGDGDVVSCSTEEDEEVDEDDMDSTESSNDTASGGDDIDSPRYRRSHPRHTTRNHRKRKGSFVGTAQYVSPEVLQNAPITPAADLWALGCIIYQMMSGLPPFRGNTDYMIFKDIIACNLDFPQGFDEDAEDLVRKLLCSNPAQRLGAQDFDGCYHSIRSHAFFRGVDFDTVRQLTPPQISPFLPDLIKDEKFRLSEHLEPGLDDRQLSRLLGLELGCVNDDFMMEKTKKTAVAYKTTNNDQNSFGQQFSTSCRNFAAPRIKTTASAKNSFDLTDSEKYERLEQQKSDKWHVFADGEVILRKGFVNKRKGLFARRRMLLLTTGPRLIYIDPVQMIKKGEIPWSPELRVEAKNFKIFFVHTPNRTYYLDDAEGYSLEWVAAIEKMHSLLYKEQTKQQRKNSTASDYNKTAIGNNILTTTTTTSGVSTVKSSANVAVIPKLTKTSSTISTRTLHKSASLLSAPFSIMKTASN